MKISDTKTTSENKIEIKSALSEYLWSRGQSGSPFEIKLTTGTNTKREEKVNVAQNVNVIPVNTYVKTTTDESGTKGTASVGIRPVVPMGPLGNLSFSEELYVSKQYTGQNAGKVSAGYKATVDAVFVARSIPAKVNNNITVVHSTQFRIGGSFSWEFNW